MSASIHELAKTGQTELLELCLKEEGIDVNLQDEDGYSPLHLAAMNGHKECVGMIMQFEEEKGIEVDLSLKDKDGRTPLHWAAMNGHSVCLMFFLNKVDKAIVNLEDNNGDTALNLADKSEG